MRPTLGSHPASSLRFIKEQLTVQLKNVIESPCGIRYMLDQLDLQSGFARRWLLDSPMMSRVEEIEAYYDELHRFTVFVEQADRTRLDTLLFKLQALKDIRTTVKNLHNHAVLDDIELFEVKHLAMSRRWMRSWRFPPLTRSSTSLTPTG